MNGVSGRHGRSLTRKLDFLSSAVMQLTISFSGVRCFHHCLDFLFLLTSEWPNWPYLLVGFWLFYYFRQVTRLLWVSILPISKICITYMVTCWPGSIGANDNVMPVTWKVLEICQERKIREGEKNVLDVPMLFVLSHNGIASRKTWQSASFPWS